MLKANTYSSEINDQTPDYKSSLEKNVNAPSPSASVKSGGYITFQKDGDLIYDGRYVAAIPAETRAPPIHNLSKYITQILATFGMVLPTRIWRCPQKLYRLLLTLWVRHLASTRMKTCGDPPFARRHLDG
jgi:hypothetical protein